VYLNLTCVCEVKTHKSIDGCCISPLIKMNWQPYKTCTFCTTKEIFEAKIFLINHHDIFFDWIPWFILCIICMQEKNSDLEIFITILNRFMVWPILVLFLITFLKTNQLIYFPWPSCTVSTLVWMRRVGIYIYENLNKPIICPMDLDIPHQLSRNIS
jgi:hypothetical protein